MKELLNAVGNCTRALRWTGALSAGALLGCTATIDGGSIPDASAGAAGQAGMGGSFPMTPMGQAQGAGPRPLLRLTQRQYVSSVKDLLATTSVPEPIQRFTPEGIGESGFIGVLPAVSTLDARLYLESAEAFTKQASVRISELAACAPGADQTDCARTFARTLARQAYRRPLEVAEADELVAVYSAGRALGYDYDKAIALVVQAVLQSPFFLYQWELGAQPARARDGLVALTHHEVASRLAYGLWGTLPDAELSRAADAGELGDTAAIVAQARRLLSDTTRAAETLWDFYTQWLFLKSSRSVVSDMTKNPDTFPDFSDALKSSMVAEAQGFLSQVVLTDDGSLQDLATARWSLVDARLAPLYGVSASGDALLRTELPASERSGLFTQPLFLAALSSDGGTLPPRMGNTMWTRILCGEMAAIPANVPQPEPAAPDVTTRERFSVHAQGGCVGCHRMLDPLGFAFENYDALGRYRTKEGSRDVDTSGALDLPSGQHVQFDNAIELLDQVAVSEDFSRCFSDQWLRYSLGRRLVDADAGTPVGVHEAFKSSGLKVKELLLSVVSSKSFLYRAVGEGEVVQ